MSIIFYPSIYLISASLLFIATATRRNGRKYVYWIPLIASVFVPAIVAGAREASVGTDTSAYVYKLFSEALRHAEIESFLGANSGSYEIGYLITTYYSAKLTENFQFLLFINQLIMLAPVVLALIMYQKGEGAGGAYLVYLLLFFGESLNMARQSMALSILFLGIVYLLNSNNVKYLICVAIAALFHISAVIGLSYWFIFRISIYETNKSVRLINYQVSRIVLTTLLLLAPVVLILAFTQLAGYFQYFKFISNKLSLYLDSSGSRVSPMQLGAYLCICLIAFGLRRQSESGRFLLICSIYAAILMSLVSLSQYFWRFTSFFLYTVPLLMFREKGYADKNGINIRYRILNSNIALSASRIGLVIIALLLWYVQIVVWGNHDVYPYTSSILGI